jgi:ADP-heptose:LPS heptosyltransferase
MGSLRKLKNVPKPLTLKDFHSKRNQILIWHDKGGLGDVLMQRMMLKDFKSFVPDSDLIFACLPEYITAIQDHPCISKVIDSRTVNPNDYIVCYNTCVTIADRYENTHSPSLEHRSDIWAKYCGVTLTEHDMELSLCPKRISNCRSRLKGKSEKRTVLFSPVSKMATKSLLSWQIEAVIETTKDYNLIAIHNREIPELNKYGIQVITDASIQEWMHYIAAADYVISVDTAAFHMAGGLKKPLVGIFTFADGKAYGKYFDFILVQKHRDNGNWACGPCFKFASCSKCITQLKPCLTELSKEEIQIGIKKMFERWPLK